MWKMVRRQRNQGSEGGRWEAGGKQGGCRLGVRGGEKQGGCK